ncbi:MAG: DUF1667 domain-containing protein [Oligoflexia bacterium]|nr:DUF1667 domain-containing protein [Oligoflexia bacterium]
MTCISCPMGCDCDTENLESITCSAGRKYVQNELTNPQRVVTTTIRVKGSNGRSSSLLPVRTSTAIPKNDIFKLMDLTRKVEVELSADSISSIKCGDIIFKDIGGSGIDLIATSSK